MSWIVDNARIIKNWLVGRKEEGVEVRRPVTDLRQLYYRVQGQGPWEFYWQEEILPGVATPVSKRIFNRTMLKRLLARLNDQGVVTVYWRDLPRRKNSKLGEIC